jgi:hypothetical protein
MNRIQTHAARSPRRGRLSSSLLAFSVALGACGGDDDGMTTPRMDLGTMADSGPSPDLGPPPPDGGTPADGGFDAATDGGFDAGADAGEAPHEGDFTLGRLLVADGAEPNVHVVDLDTMTRVATLTVSGAARVYGDMVSPLGYAVQTGAGRVQVLQAGVVFESHGDHYHIDKVDPSLLTAEMTGSTPIHFVHHDGFVAVFFDGTGELQYVQERTILAGAPVVSTVASGQPHHGVGLVAFGHVLLSHPELTPMSDPPRHRPVGVTTRRFATPSTVADTILGCTSLHGEAAAGDHVAFGCAEGVLVVERHGGHLDHALIPNPPETPPGTRVGTVIASEELPFMVGNFGRGGLVRIDFEAGTLTPHLLPADHLSFRFDPHGERLLVLTVDGKLHALNPSTFAALGPPIDLFAPFAVMPGHSQIRPALEDGTEHAFVSDPRTGTVHVVHLEDWEVEGTVVVGGMPGALAVVAVSPDWETAGMHMHMH